MINQTLTAQMRFETAVAKVVNGVIYKSYSNIARYVYLMRVYDKNVKQLKKAIKKHCKDCDLYINNGTLQNETRVANAILNLDFATDSADCKEYTTKFNNLLSNIFNDCKDCKASVLIANIETFFQDNALNYRNVIQTWKKAETETPETETAETETPETETAETETPETETPETINFETICAAVKKLDKKQLAKLDIMIQGILTGNAETETAETQKAKSKKQKAS